MRTLEDLRDSGLKDFDVQACKVGDFVFRTVFPEHGLLVRTLKPSPSTEELYVFESEELPYMEFEASLAKYGTTVIRTWRRIY